MLTRSGQKSPDNPLQPLKPAAFGGVLASTPPRVVRLQPSSRGASLLDGLHTTVGQKLPIAGRSGMPGVQSSSGHVLPVLSASGRDRYGGLRLPAKLAHVVSLDKAAASPLSWAHGLASRGVKGVGGGIADVLTFLTPRLRPRIYRELPLRRSRLDFKLDRAATLEDRAKAVGALRGDPNYQSHLQAQKAFDTDLAAGRELMRDVRARQAAALARNDRAALQQLRQEAQVVQNDIAALEKMRGFNRQQLQAYEQPVLGGLSLDQAAADYANRARAFRTGASSEKIIVDALEDVKARWQRGRRNLMVGGTGVAAGTAAYQARKALKNDMETPPPGVDAVPRAPGGSTSGGPDLSVPGGSTSGGHPPPTTAGPWYQDPWKLGLGAAGLAAGGTALYSLFGRKKKRRISELDGEEKLAGQLDSRDEMPVVALIRHVNAMR